MQGAAKDDIGLSHRCRQQCGDGQREGGLGAKGGKMGTSVIVPAIKIKLKTLK